MLLRKAFVGVLAVSLAASGLTWQACLAKQAAPSPRPAATAAHAQHHTAHGAHKHQIDVSSLPAPATDGQSADDRGCMKCCSLCVVSGVAPSGISAKTVLAASFVVFSFEQDQYADRTILVDPGIPKRIG
jgi:hypothetical protein